MQVKKRQVAKYVMLPEILPRIYDFATSGFGHIALFMAYVFRAARLLPAGHPYLQPANTGRFGLRHVILEAFHSLKFRRENIDQIIIFFTLVAGVVLLFTQFALLVVMVLIPMAHAGGGSTVGADFKKFFGQNNSPTYDIAYMMLDRVFGYKEIFGSCFAKSQPCQYDVLSGNATGPVTQFPTPFQEALHGLFNFYNYGLLAIGLIVFIYLITTVVAETAQSGTPFGKRFNHFWVPIRLIVAIALLLPVSQGLSVAQYITLHVAKWGSNLGTNSWIMFTGEIKNQTLLGKPENLVVTPVGPDPNTLPEFMSVAVTCKLAYAKLYNITIEGYIVGGASGMESSGEPEKFAGLKYAAAREKTQQNFPGSKTIVISFGEYKDVPEYNKFQSNVRPYCGQIHMNIEETKQPGSLKIQDGYYELLKQYWPGGGMLWWSTEGEASKNMVKYAEGAIKRYLQGDDRDPNAEILTLKKVEEERRLLTNCVRKKKTGRRGGSILDWLEDLLYGDNRDCSNGFIAVIDNGVQAQIDEGKWDKNFSVHGWGGAALWFSTIAEANGTLVASAYNVPVARFYPEVMEYVVEQRRKQDNVVTGVDRYNPILSNGRPVSFGNDRDFPIAATLWSVQTTWIEGYNAPKGNIFRNAIISLFGLNGLIDLRQNADIHPLAQLVGVGRSLIESAIVNFGFSFGAGMFGGIANLLMDNNLIGTVGHSWSSFFGKIAMIGLIIGFVLYYIVPFMPFIYFFFALGGWVKAIFEAMVGVPLWALAHIRIDGEGLPGPAAMNGYVLLFEIFLRPVLIVFGMLGAISIFAALVQVLHEIFDLVVANTSGANWARANVAASATGAATAEAAEEAQNTISFLRQEIDQFFYTIIYAVIVYMTALSCFKLIDLIPNHVLRWISQSVSAFGDGSGDPVDNIVAYTREGTANITGQAQGVMGSVTGIMVRN